MTFLITIKYNYDIVSADLFLFSKIWANNDAKQCGTICIMSSFDLQDVESIIASM